MSTEKIFLFCLIQFIELFGNCIHGNFNADKQVRLDWRPGLCFHYIVSVCIENSILMLL